MVRVFINGQEDWGLIPNQLILKTQKIVLDASLVLIKGNLSNPEKGVAPSLDLGVVPMEKGAFGPLSTMVGQLTIYIYIYMRVIQKVPSLTQKEDP